MSIILSFEVPGPSVMVLLLAVRGKGGQEVLIVLIKQHQVRRSYMSSNAVILYK